MIFIEDNKYKNLKEVVENTSIAKIVLMSLQDSLPKEGNPFFDLDKQHEELFKSKVDNIKKTNPMVMGVDEFESIGSEYSGEIEDKSVTLEDEFTITYSSGTTSNRPKGIIHAVRSLHFIFICILLAIGNEKQSPKWVLVCFVILCALHKI